MSFPQEGAEAMESTQTYTHVPQPLTPPPAQPQPRIPEVKRQQVHRIAAELFKQQPDLVTFFRKVLGVDGIARQLFTTSQEMTVLEQSGEYAEIQQMLAKLRERGGSPPDASEPTRVITVRLPKSLHESLRTEAHEKRTSMNKLCISKLLQMVDEQLIPSD
jgi:predicted HicB family RNase H-like nuclease